MKVSQIYEWFPEVNKQIMGEKAVSEINSTNVVELGKSITALENGRNFFEPIFNELINRIGDTIWEDRVLTMAGPPIYKKAVEYGSIIRKIDMEMPEEVENKNWQLQNGVSYDPNIFVSPPPVNVQYWNELQTFRINQSFVTDIFKQSFTSKDDMDRLFSTIMVKFENKLTMDAFDLNMALHRDLIAATAYADYTGSAWASKSGVKARNLLYMYKQLNPNTTLTKETCLYDLDFLKFAVQDIVETLDHMAAPTKTFNIGNALRWTPSDKAHLVLLSHFKRLAEFYLNSVTFHDYYVKLPNASIVPYWQGSGTSWSLADCSKVDIDDSENHHVSLPYVLGMAYDDSTLMICNESRKTTSNYNGVSDFTNYFTSVNVRNFRDARNNGVIWFVA